MADFIEIFSMDLIFLNFFHFFSIKIGATCN